MNSSLKLAFFIFTLCQISSCADQKSFSQAHQDSAPQIETSIDSIPTQLEKPVSLEEEENALPQGPALPEPTRPVLPKPTEVKIEETPAPQKPSRPVAVKPPIQPQKPTRPSEPTQPSKPTTPKPTPQPQAAKVSRFIQVAYWVVQNEAKKLGTACNFYVSRVLELSGFSDDSFMANDFDVYAKKNFSHYRLETFDTARKKSEEISLRRYLWSYPERTPFIIQWERGRGRHGHVAIVERIGEQLIIYQASMNKHIPRRDQTTVELLLSKVQQGNMHVYSEFQP